MKFRLIALVILIAFSLTLFAQSELDSLKAASKEDGKIEGFFSNPEFPELIYFEPAIYPPNCKQLGKEGTVLLDALVSKTREIADISVKRTTGDESPEFNAAAIEAVKKWKFQPVRYGPKPSDCSVVIPIDFSHTGFAEMYKPVKLHIKSRPRKAFVSIDGIYLVTTQNHIHLTPYEDHKLVITKPGYETIEQIIKVCPLDEGHVKSYQLKKSLGF